MAKDFADITRIEQAVVASTDAATAKQERVSAFVKAWENQTARRAAKGGAGMTMALTLAACGGSDGGGAGTPDPEPTPDPIPFALVDAGVTEVSGENPIVEVPSPTAGADTLTTTLSGSGTGTLTLRFVEDEDDTVVLASASDLSGYDTLAIEAGTVNIAAVDISSITSITVASGVVMTAAQLVNLTTISGLSDEAALEILVATQEEIDAVFAAASKIKGKFDAENVSFISDTIPPAVLADKNEELAAALEAAQTASALPEAVDALREANEAIEAFNQKALENEDVVEALADGVEPEDADAAQVSFAIRDALEAAATALNDGGITGDVTDAQRAANIAAARETLADTISEAQEAVADTRKAVVDDEDLGIAVANLVVKLVEAEGDVETTHDAFHKAQAAAEEALTELIVDAELTDGQQAALVFEFDPRSYEDGTDGPHQDSKHQAFETVTYAGRVVLQVDGDGKIVATAALVKSEDGKNYVIAGDAVADPVIPSLVLPVEDVDALIVLLQAERDAFEEMLEADAGLRDARDALVEADAATLVPAADEMAPLLIPDDLMLIPGPLVSKYDELTVDGKAGDYYDDVKDLAAAQEASATFEEALASWQALNALAEEELALYDVFDEAKAAIENGADDDPAGLGVAVKEVGESGDTGTEDESDLFIVSRDSDAGIKISGNDFVAFDFDTTFTFVELGEDDVLFDGDPTDDMDFGSATTREIFAQEEDGDVILYIENIATAGNGTSGADFTSVTLEGVTMDDLTFDTDSQILTAVNEIVS